MLLADPEPLAGPFIPQSTLLPSIASTPPKGYLINNSNVLALILEADNTVRKKDLVMLPFCFSVVPALQL